MNKIIVVSLLYGSLMSLSSFCMEQEIVGQPWYSRFIPQKETVQYYFDKAKNALTQAPSYLERKPTQQTFKQYDPRRLFYRGLTLEEYENLDKQRKIEETQKQLMANQIKQIAEELREKEELEKEFGSGWNTIRHKRRVLDGVIKAYGRYKDKLLELQADLKDIQLVKSGLALSIGKHQEQKKEFEEKVLMEQEKQHTAQTLRMNIPNDEDFYRKKINEVVSAITKLKKDYSLAEHKIAELELTIKELNSFIEKELIIQQNEAREDLQVAEQQVKQLIKNVEQSALEKSEAEAQLQRLHKTREAQKASIKALKQQKEYKKFPPLPLIPPASEYRPYVPTPSAPPLPLSQDIEAEEQYLGSSSVPKWTPPVNPEWQGYPSLEFPLMAK